MESQRYRIVLAKVKTNFAEFTEKNIGNFV